MSNHILCTLIHACAIGVMLPELERVGSMAFDRVRIVYMISGRTKLRRYTRSRGRRPWPASALVIWNMSNSACLHTIEHTKLSYRSQHDKSSKAFQIKFTCICIPAESSANGTSPVAQFVTRPASRVMNPSSRRMFLAVGSHIRPSTWRLFSPTHSIICMLST
jgi:hypothetical protein